MNTEETNLFVDCVTYEDCTAIFHGKLYWCLGMTFDKATGIYAVEVHECTYPQEEFIKEALFHESTSKDECMKHFLEDKYWDGKSFYEVAHEIEWVDL